jgi:hypothetical protein
MANSLFIKFTSLPQNPGLDSLSFKYNSVATTLNVIFGPGPGKCPIATTVNDQADNLATFLSTTYPTQLVVPTPSGDTVTVVATNGSNISNANQVVNTIFSPITTHSYLTNDDGSPDDAPQLPFHNTAPNFSVQTIGAGSTIRIKCYWRWATRSCPDWFASNYNTYYPSAAGLAMDYTFTIPTDKASIIDAFNDHIAGNTNWTSWANVALNAYSMNTTSLPAGVSNFRFRMNGQNRGNGSGCSSTKATQNVEWFVRRAAPGARYTTMTVTPSDTASGSGKQVLLDTIDDVALFLSTDFLDLSGKNNQVAYRDSTFINFDDASTSPSVGPSTTVILCKEAITGGNPINSYEYGSAGGLNLLSYSVPGWEWWNRSYLVRDTVGQGGEGDSIYSNLVFLISQQVDTGTLNPGTKAITQ